MGRETHARERLLLAALLLFVAGLCLQPITESDLFFRLRVGREIWTSHALPRRNLFSFTAPEYPDLDLSWAFEAVAALIHRAGGFFAVVVAKTVWIAGAFAAAFALSRRRGGDRLSATVVLAAAAFVMCERLVERPHIVSFAGEVAVIWALDTVNEPWSRSRAGTFFIAMVAWGNMHAGIFAGVFLALLAALGASFVDRRRARRALVLAGAIAGAATINPAGPLGLLRYLRLHVTLPQLHTVDEFRTATWRSDAPFFVWLLLGSIVLVATAAERRANRSRLDEQLLNCEQLLPVIGMSLLGIASVRFSADAVLVGAPLLIPSVCKLSQRLLSVAAAHLDRVVLRRLASTTTISVLVLATLAPRVAAARAGHPFLNLAVDTTELPLEGLRFVTANGLRERMYNDFEIGSYLLFEGYPRYRVFVDPRLPAYPEDMHRLLGAFALDRAAWTAAMTHYGVESALLAYAGLNRRVAWWDPADWALVYRAHDTRVFVRRHPKWRDLIVAHEIPATFDFTVEEGTTTRPLEAKPARSPVRDCEWQRRLGDLVFELEGGKTTHAEIYFERALSPRACLAPDDEASLSSWLGALEAEAKAGVRGSDPEHTLTHLTRALDLRPTDTPTRANRARLFERLRRWQAAAADWNLVARDQPTTAVGIAAAARAQTLAARAGSASPD